MALLPCLGLLLFPLLSLHHKAAGLAHLHGCGTGSALLAVGLPLLLYWGMSLAGLRGGLALIACSKS